jgi:hypothetical protein
MAMDSERVIKTRRFEQTVLRQAVLGGFGAFKSTPSYRGS